MMQKDKLVIDGLREQDVPQMAEIERLCFSEPWSEETIRAELTTPFSRYFICREDDRVLGYIGTRILLGECDVTNIAVRPELRRQGIASFLFERMLPELYAQKVTVLNLEVRENNLPARAFYEKCGFQVCGRRKKFYRCPEEDAILMNCVLEDK